MLYLNMKLGFLFMSKLLISEILGIIHLFGIINLFSKGILWSHILQTLVDLISPHTYLKATVITLVTASNLNSL